MIENIGEMITALRPLTGVAGRRWNALVVIDAHASMEMWRDMIDTFVGTAGRRGAFRSVQVRRLDTDAKEPAGVKLQGIDQEGPPDPPSRRQQAIFVVTDGSAPAWHTGAAMPLLHRWACRRPMAIVHVLPPEQWHRSGVAPRRLWMRSQSTGLANKDLEWQPRDLLPVDVAPAAVPIPVLDLSPGWLETWATLVAGGGSRWIGLPAVLTEPTAPMPMPSEPGTWSPTQHLRSFYSYASPTACTLATYLAAVPLHADVIRFVRSELLPESDTSHLAELVNGGLLRPVETARTTLGLSYEFVAGMRQELLALGRRGDTVRVWREVAARLGAMLPGVALFSKVLDDPDSVPVPDPSPALVPYLQVEGAVLRALSGRYMARSRRIEEKLLRVSEPALQTLTVETPTTTNVVVRSGGTGVSSSPAPTADVPFSPSPAPAAAPSRTPSRAPVIWGNIPPRNPNFTGRTKLLEDLHKQIRSGTTAVLPHALHGMGGVGKSHLALQYVYLHQAEYELIWWISAERVAQLDAAMVELAQRMRLSSGPDVGSARAAVLEALRLGEPYKRWLLIFDNAEGPEVVRPYLPAGGPGSTMITSRNPLWSSVASSLEVDVFTREESIQLLQRRGPELDPGDADQLAEVLGDLPLALEQAAAWRAQTGMSADEYLRLFAETEQRVKLLAQITPMDYPLTVATAWNVSLDWLMSFDRAAFRLLQVCSFLAPEPIPRALLFGAHNLDVHPELNPALRDAMLLNQAIRDITRYSLAKIDHRTGSIQMHRLVQAVLRDRMPPAEQGSMRESAHLLLASGDRNYPDMPANWPSYAGLYPHVDASGAVHSTEPGVQQLIENEAKYLYWSGQYKTALDLCQSAYESWRRKLGDDASAVLSIGHRLGFMLYVHGRYKEAAEYNRLILTAYERTSTEDTEDLLRQHGAVAADLRIAGEFAEALRLDEDIYRRYLRLLGEDDPETLNAANNLAVSLRLNGDLRKAYQVDEETYHRRVLLFGEDHPHTLGSHLNLIIDRRELGDYLEARAEMLEIVERLTNWGAEPAQILRAKRRLAPAIRKAGDHEEAMRLSEEIRASYAEQYGQGHPETLLAELGRAVDLRATGRLEEGIEFGEHLRDRYRDLLGREHPHTVSAALNTAVAHRLQGDIALARRTNEEGLAILVRRLGADHPLTLAGDVNLASDLYEQGDSVGAFERDCATVVRLSRVLGDDHPLTLLCQSNLVMDLLALDRRAEADELHPRVVARMEARLGAEHPASLAARDITIRANCDLDPMPL